LTDTVKIYVYMPDEGVDVWRPVQAEHLGGNVYRIVEQPYDREDEIWQFEPGDVVACEMTRLSGGWFLVATPEGGSRVNGESSLKEAQIDEAMHSGKQPTARNKANGNPAARYVDPEKGASFFVDHITNEVIHVGRSCFQYGPDSGDIP